MEQQRKKDRVSKRINRIGHLKGKPQIKGICERLTIRKPKKPNSAKRKIAKVRLLTGKRLIVHIPGEGHTLGEYGRVLVRGGKVKDLPGVKYRVIRGVLDADGIDQRRQSRSKYGRDLEGLDEKKKGKIIKRKLRIIMKYLKIKRKRKIKRKKKSYKGNKRKKKRVLYKLPYKFKLKKENFLIKQIVKRLK